MSQAHRSPRAYLTHAIECIDSIVEYTAEGQQAFRNDKKTRDAVLRNLGVISQCLKDAGIERLQTAHPQIRWRRIANFRNVLAHEYIGVDDELVWEIVATQQLPLRNALAEYLTNLSA